MADKWTKEAMRRLLSAQFADGSWGYRAGGEAAAEPTALAALAACRTAEASEKNARVAAHRAGAWLERVQSDSGAVLISPSAVAVWPTPLALLLWRALGGFEEPRRRAIQALLRLKGETQEHNPDDPAGHDTSIPGWPWVSGTHSWVEPTALAIIALSSEGQRKHERVSNGLRLLQDRVIPGGGWNYGNSKVFDTALRPQPAPTGLALLALLGRNGAAEPLIADSCRYLEVTLPKTRSPQTLCWGIWGLHAWGRRPAEAAEWLSQAFALVNRRPDPYLQLAYLLLASSAPLPAFLPLEGDRRE